jgi:peptidoglycan/xylan/chitin deacetylase (PgdA/CDA1 family)
VITQGVGHVVALTFDDGPTPGVTDRLLDVLEHEHVHATFFVVGRAARSDPGMLRRMAADGDEIEDHSETHAHLNALLPAAIDHEIAAADAAIAAATGRHAHLLRPPFGARNAAVLDAAQRRGMRVVLWSVTGRAGEISSHAGEGAIVLLHDGDRGRGDAGELAYQAADVPQVIAMLRARGFRFVTLAELLHS